MYSVPPPSPAVSSTTPSSEGPPGKAVVNQVHVQNTVPQMTHEAGQMNERTGNLNHRLTGTNRPMDQIQYSQQQLQRNSADQRQTNQGQNSQQTGYQMVYPQNGNNSTIGQNMDRGLQTFPEIRQPPMPPLAYPASSCQALLQHSQDTSPKNTFTKPRTPRKRRALMDDNEEAWVQDSEIVALVTSQFFKELKDQPKKLLEARDKIVTFITKLHLEELKRAK